MKKLIFLMILFWSSSIWAAPQVILTHALALHGEPKYPADFTHFEYADPNALKGGTLTRGARGTYDNLHRYAQRGVSAAGSSILYDSLLVESADEIESYYGLIAEKIEYPEDFTWMTFHLHPQARFQDGTPLTAEDVVYSFNTFFEKGVPQFKQYYQDVSEVVALDPHKVRFSVKEGNKEMLLSLGGIPVISRHFWESHDFSEPLTTPPVGSSAYQIKDFKIGQYIVYERVKDYWGANLPVNKGQNNFDEIRYDYYRDEIVSLEAFKAGEFDVRQENVSKQWATLYTGSNFEKGYIIKEEIDHDIPQGMQALVFNIQRPVFSDSRVREALNYAMDFEWMNENLFYGQYKRTRSYFQNTEYEAKGLPGEEELKILDPLRDQIPERVFTEEYQPPVTEGSGNIRQQIREALKLFKEAGWEIKDKVLTNVETGEPLEFELLLYSPSMERIAVPVQKNLERMGVKMNIRQVDTTQFTNRLRERDFDMISSGFGANYYPGTDLKIVWRSDYLDYTYNIAGVQDPAVDALVDGIEAAQGDEDALLHYGRAFDRILQWNFYVIPQWHISKFRVAYWDKFSRPEIRPKYTLGIGTWWVDPEKEMKLPERNVAP